MVIIFAVPCVVLFFNPWSRICCEQQDIDIRTGKARYTWYFYSMRVFQITKETVLSQALSGSVVKSQDPEWQPVNTFSPMAHHSPHYRFHSALAQIHEVGLVFLVTEPDSKTKQDIVQRVLTLWQTSGTDDGAKNYIRELQEELDKRSTLGRTLNEDSKKTNHQLPTTSNQ